MSHKDKAVQKQKAREYYLAHRDRFLADGGECEMHYSLDARLPE
jgi:hypothetical protein